MDYEVEQDSLLMVCATTGFPPTATLWSKDGILLSLNETYSEDMYITEQAMTDAHTASYRNTLKIVQDRSEMDGLYGCDVYSDWVTADFTLNGREREWWLLLCSYTDGRLYWLIPHPAYTPCIVPT